MSLEMISYTRIKFAFLVFLTMGLTSCSDELLPELHIESVSIYTEPDTNQNSAIAVDLVMIYDSELVKMIGQLSAAKYFASSKDLLLDNPSLLDIWHWELVPGQTVQDFSPPQEQGDAFAAYVFANYLTPGNHRIRVSPQGVVKILLMKNDLKNLAMYDLHDVRIGKTMSDRDSGIEEPEEEYEMKLGPTVAPAKLCKKAGPHPVQQSQQVTDNSSNYYCPKQPIPIITRPLKPPPAVICKPYKKVRYKNGQIKY